jgi:hypothetical protein
MIPSTCIWGENPMRFSPFNGRDVLLRVRVLIQGGLWKRRLFFVFKAGGETSGHANHAGIATTDGYDFDFGFGQAVEAIDNFINELIRESNLRFKRDELVFGFLETGTDVFFVGFFEAEFVGAEMGENFGGFKLPKLVELGFGLQGVSVNVVEIFEVGQELFGGRPFLLVHRHHPLGEKCAPVWQQAARSRRPAHGPVLHPTHCVGKAAWLCQRAQPASFPAS